MNTKKEREEIQRENVRRREGIKHTDDRFGKRSSLQGCQTQVTDFDTSRRSSDEDIVTLEITMNDRRSARMKEL